MPPSISSANLHSKRPQIPTYFTTSYRPPPCHQVRRIVTTETAKNQNLNIRPLPPKTSDPLRILFCGSDHFSCASLSALHDLHKAQPQLVDSIDVLVRPGKPSGRGLKRIAVGPLFHLATELGLPIHQRDTFTGWSLPLPGRVTNTKTGVCEIHPHPSGTLRHRSHLGFNLLIAVSFGLFVPPRILDTLKYGGLNIHPSLLPDLRGPAPIQWSILLNRSHTGCTLQTLHPTVFDQGTILLQTPRPGMPIPDGCTAADLLATLATKGANMLVQGLINDRHIPSCNSTRVVPPDPAAPPAQHALRDAPKITKNDLSIDWGSLLWGRDHELYPGGQWTAADLARRFRAVAAGKPRGLWTHAITAGMNPCEQRLIFEDVEAVACPPALRAAVRSILQIKLASAAGGVALDGEALRRLSYPDDLGNVVFGSQPDWAAAQREFRMPVYVGAEDGEAWTSVIIPLRVPYRVVDGVVEIVEGGEFDAVRVKRIKVAGSVSKEASAALGPFFERNVIVEDIAALEYAIDVMAKQVA